MRVWSELDQRLIEIPDPPKDPTLKDIWVQNKVTQVYVHSLRKLDRRVAVNRAGLTSLWAFLLILLSIHMSGVL